MDGALAVYGGRGARPMGWPLLKAEVSSGIFVLSVRYCMVLLGEV